MSGSRPIHGFSQLSTVSDDEVSTANYQLFYINNLNNMDIYKIDSGDMAWIRK
jgi:hypothetical protein